VIEKRPKAAAIRAINKHFQNFFIGVKSSLPSTPRGSTGQRIANQHVDVSYQGELLRAVGCHQLTLSGDYTF
jgi:hypothetical protein